MSAAVARQKGRPGALTAMFEEMRSAAAAVQVAPADLERWYGEQLAYAREQRDELGAKLARNLDRLASAERDDARWPKYWRQDATYRWWCKYVESLEAANHVQVCVNHGIPGVTGGPPEGTWEGLAWRGHLEGVRTAWEAYCASCSGAWIEAVVQQMEEAWKTS